MNIYWTKYRNILKGRDPLGIQSVNIQLYGQLVPGITNVTERLRYYSFYPWLFQNYHNSNIKNKYKLDLVPFLRRAEFLFGLITNFHHKNELNWSGHMVGTNTIVEIFKTFDNIKHLSLSRYTQLEESNLRYFANRNGGFGQYYIGALSQLESGDGAYKC